MRKRHGSDESKYNWREKEFRKKRQLKPTGGIEKSTKFHLPGTEQAILKRNHLDRKERM